MTTLDIKSTGAIIVSVSDKLGGEAPVQNAKIKVWGKPASKTGDAVQNDFDSPEAEPYVKYTDAQGRARFEGLPPGTYSVSYKAFGGGSITKNLKDGETFEKYFKIPINFTVQAQSVQENGALGGFAWVTAGTPVVLTADHNRKDEFDVLTYSWKPDDILVEHGDQQNAREVHVITDNLTGRVEYSATLRDPGKAEIEARGEFTVLPSTAQRVGGNVGVTLLRSQTHQTLDQALWVAIRNRTKAIAFSGSGYKDFIDRVLCEGDVPKNSALSRSVERLGDHVYGMRAYELLKTATEVFLLLECGVKIRRTGAHDEDAIFDPREEGNRLGLGRSIQIGEIRERLTEYLGPGRLPYIDRILKTAFQGEKKTDRVHCNGVLASRAEQPCLLELIWSYWNEEGMLVQTMNAVSRRFQNIHGAGKNDPLAHLEIAPLRPMNNLLWGYVQDENNRLSVKRRAYEYAHEYGLTLYGKAVPALRSADRRSKFLEGFHNLLHRCAAFFDEDSDTTRIAGGYPLLMALKEVHLLLAQGAHNQFGDLPWTARVEMLMQQWLLARPEIRDFLHSRAMVPYKEAWMPPVDTMKTLQGWSDVTVTHFRDLAVVGEPLLLSIRYGDWIGINDEDSAKNWARYWHSELQNYLHAYRAVTGVDLTNPDTVDFTVPSEHLRKRLALQHQTH